MVFAFEASTLANREGAHLTLGQVHVVVYCMQYWTVYTYIVAS